MVMFIKMYIWGYVLMNWKSCVVHVPDFGQTRVHTYFSKCAILFAQVYLFVLFVFTEKSVIYIVVYM